MFILMSKILQKLRNFLKELCEWGPWSLEKSTSQSLSLLNFFGIASIYTVGLESYLKHNT